MAVDAMTVVDLELRGHGPSACACAITPRLVSSNTNADAMIGQKAADPVRGMLQQEAMAPEALHAAT